MNITLTQKLQKDWGNIIDELSLNTESSSSWKLTFKSFPDITEQDY
ncbi:hypothetical protein [Dapis sp. BLCC M172]